MRYVRKGPDGGYHLSQAHCTPPVTPGQAKSRWRSFGHKADVLDRLLWEQYRLCCYAEVRADEEGLGYHIEHVENKSQNPGRTFDYTNLSASAVDRDVGLPALASVGESAFGGHATGKQAGVDINRFVSCHQADCARFFAYLSDGRVVPATDLGPVDWDRADYTIDLLHLNAPFLVVRRKQWWDELDKAFWEHYHGGREIEHLIAVDLLPRQWGNKRYLQRFFSLTRQYYKGAADAVILASDPTLL